MLCSQVLQQLAEVLYVLVAVEELDWIVMFSAVILQYRMYTCCVVDTHHVTLLSRCSDCLLNKVLPCRCLKSCQDVAVACQSDLSNGMLACTIYLAPQPTSSECGQQISSCLRAFLTGSIDDAFSSLAHEATSADNVDCGYTDQDGSQQCGDAATAAVDESDSDDHFSGSDGTADADIVDDYLKPPVMHRHWQPLVLVVGVPALPKGALVEVQPEACTVQATADPLASDTSSDDEGEVRPRDGHQTVNSRNWASRLVNRSGSFDGTSTGNWSSLTSQGVYCCCQVDLAVSSGSVDTDIGRVVHVLSNSLAIAGLATEHVISLTAYAQVSFGTVVGQIEDSFRAHWQAQHAQQLPLVVVLPWLLMSGTGADLLANAKSQSQMCARLTAHRLVNS